MPGRSRPRIFAALAALITLPVLASCASSSTPGSGAPVSGGTLVYAADQLPDCLDPAVSSLDIVGTVDREVFDSLVWQGADGSFHPWLAGSWSVSPAGTVYTFHLRSGVTFQDGTPLNAAAVVTSLDHVVAPTTESEYAASLLGPFAGASAVDSSTVQIKLSAPFAPLLQALSTPYLGIQSPKALKDESQSQLCAHPVGSGPYSFASWTKPTSIALKNNPAYRWAPQGSSHQGAAYLAGITFQFNTEDASRFGSLTSDQADVIDDVPPVDVSTLKADTALSLLTEQLPGAVYLLGLNTAGGPLADVKVRQALQRSINLDELVRSVYFDQYARAWSPLSPSTPDYDSALANSWPYDPTLANRLLDEAGWTGRDAAGYRTKDGEQLTLRWPAESPRQDRSALAQGIQAEAKAVGIDVDYMSEDSGTYIQDLIKGKLDIVDTSFVRDDPDILRHFYASDETVLKGGANEFGLDVPQLNQWLSGGSAGSDQTARRQDYQDAQQYIIQNALDIPVYVPTALVGYNNSVHGLTLDPDGTALLYGVWMAK